MRFFLFPFFSLLFDLGFKIFFFSIIFLWLLVFTSADVYISKSADRLFNSGSIIS